MASHPTARPMHAMPTLVFDMAKTPSGEHTLPTRTAHRHTCKRHPKRRDPPMAHNEGAPTHPSLSAIIHRLQVIGHTIASKSSAYNNPGHRGQYAGEGAVNGSWSRLHAFRPWRARV